MFLCVYMYVIVLGQVYVVFQTLLVLWFLLTIKIFIHTFIIWIHFWQETPVTCTCLVGGRLAYGCMP